MLKVLCKRLVLFSIFCVSKQEKRHECNIAIVKIIEKLLLEILKMKLVTMVHNCVHRHLGRCDEERKTLYTYRGLRKKLLSILQTFCCLQVPEIERHDVGKALIGERR